MLNIKKIFSVLFIFSILNVYCQNKQVLYNFAELPQTLLLNPGAETNYKFHIGVPFLSGFSAEYGSTGFTISDLFVADNKSINDKVSSVIKNTSLKDYAKFNLQLEVFNAGYRYDDKTYLSFGFYEELDGIAYFPKDAVTLLTEGNASYLNKSFSLSQLLYKVDVLGVLHFGVTRKLSDKLTVGGRFKLYSSALNMESLNNSGTFTTVNGNNNIYTHYLNNIDVNLNTSGLIDNDNEIIDNPKTYLGNTLLGSNFGVGFDIGMTYHFSEQLEFTGSIVDFGFIKHSKNSKSYFVNGNYAFEGFAYNYDLDNPNNYWNELEADFKEKLDFGDNNDAYISWRPTKINTSLRYSFGEKRSKQCYDNTQKDFYTDALGVQLYTILRPLGPQFALTAFYEKSLSKKIHSKVTYTVDNYSFYNIGAGLSAQFGKINFYGMVDNIAQFRDIASVNNISVQLGINVIFN